MVYNYLKAVRSRTYKDFRWWFQWPVIWGIGALLLIKWSDLTLPLYWDELGVYGPGILHMLDHGIGLLPDSLPPELSRGHPLLFYAFFATLIKLSGYSLLALHVIAFLITILWAFSILYIGRQMWGREIGNWGFILLIFSPNVAAQATLVLPEIFLGLVCLWALYFFYIKKYLFYIICAVVALMTKETALVLLASTLIYGFWQNRDTWVKTTTIAIAPVLSYLVFLLIQKGQYGWYFFPLHVDLVSWAPADIIRKLGIAAQWLFIDQGRFFWSIIIVLSGLLWLWHKKESSLKIDGFAILIALFFGGIVAFSCLNVYMDRYLISLMPFWACLLASALLNVRNLVFAAIPMAAIDIILIVYLAISFWASREYGGFRFDVNLNYREIVHVQKEATDYLAENLEEGIPFYANFPFFNGFLDERYGYIETGKKYAPTVSYHDSLKWAAVMVPPQWAGGVKPTGKIVQSFQQDFIRIDIYENNDSTRIHKILENESER